MAKGITSVVWNVKSASKLYRARIHQHCLMENIFIRRVPKRCVFFVCMWHALCAYVYCMCCIICTVCVICVSALYHISLYAPYVLCVYFCHICHMCNMCCMCSMCCMVTCVTCVICVMRVVCVTCVICVICVIYTRLCSCGLCVTRYVARYMCYTCDLCMLLLKIFWGFMRHKETWPGGNLIHFVFYSYINCTNSFYISIEQRQVPAM